jgi:D-beta-D-heptose 7-phosphate kinase/D-beta-D-heptose 1-phosphate adenosyltransferase
MNPSSDLIDRFAELNVLVIGEAMLDSYLQGSTNRLCPEAPVPIVTLSKRQDVPGGAANTAVNAQSLGAHVTLLSVIGDDLEGALLRQALVDRGVSTDSILTQPNRRTLAKQRVMTGSQMLLRLDQGSTQAIAPEMEHRLIDCLMDLFPRCDAVIASDYGYGILTDRIIQTLTKLQGQCPRTLVVDAKTLTAYRQAGATAVKPNYAEAVQLLGPQEFTSGSRAESMTLHGKQLLDQTGAQIVAVTLDTEGALIFERDSQPYRTYAQPASDACAIGAGDTFVSTLALALAAGGQTSTAAELAAAAAAIVVSQDGTAACCAEELRSRSVPEGITAMQDSLERNYDNC